MSEFDPVSISRRVFRTRGGRLVYLVVAILVVLLFVYNASFVYVHPNQFAIKQVTIGPGKGIGTQVYRAGLQWVTPGTERLHVFPTDVQLLALTSDPSERHSEDANSAPALRIQTSEGYNVTVDVSVLYRVEDPYKVLTTVGPGKLYESALVVPRSEQILRKRLGELDAEEFYDVTKRLEKEKLALVDLNAELVPAGIRAMHVFVAKYAYDERYQSAIEQRKIQDQTVFKNQAEAEMASQAAEKNRIVAVGEAAVKVELARGDGEKNKLEATAELYERTQRAQGEKELKLAEAEGTRLEAEALKGRGSEYLVGLKMADTLKNTRIIVLPSDGEGGTNPLDLKSALKRFDVNE